MVTSTSVIDFKPFPESRSARVSPRLSIWSSFRQPMRSSPLKSPRTGRAIAGVATIGFAAVLCDALSRAVARPKRPIWLRQEYNCLSFERPLSPEEVSPKKKTMLDVDCCANCRYMRYETRNIRSGNEIIGTAYHGCECHYDPPKMSFWLRLSRWPRVPGDAWCGRHEREGFARAKQDAA